MDALQRKILDQFVIESFDTPNNKLYVTYRVSAFGFGEIRAIPIATLREAPNGWIQTVLDDMVEQLFRKINYARLNQR